MQELVQLRVFSRSFSMPCASFSMVNGPGGTWHRKASAKNSSKLNKFLQSEVNQLKQHIIMQDQDRQNNNKDISSNKDT